MSMVSGKPHLMADLCASENPGKLSALYYVIVRVLWSTSDNRGSESKSVNCHSDDNGHKGFLDGQVFQRT